MGYWKERKRADMEMMMKRGRGTGTLNRRRSSPTILTGLLKYILIAFMHDACSQRGCC